VSALLHLAIEDGVASLEMCDLATKNALGEEMVSALRDSVSQLAADASVRVVILLGSDEVFCSGAPKALLLRLARGELAPTDVALATALLDVPVPTIAAMEGHATGGGLALGLCADIILMAEESRYGATFMNLGFTPGMGTTRLLEHVLSPAVAHELLYTGELRRGRDFAGRGVNHVLPRTEVRSRALDIARRIAEKPRESLLLLKESLSAPRRATLAAARAEEARMHAVTFARPETLQAITDHYLEDT
jgi:polyketide biosynthesis enoyl-CoA hydratase PksI